MSEKIKPERNWTKAKAELIALAVEWVMERGYTSTEGMGKTFADTHYMGHDRRLAATHLQKRIDAAVAEAKYQGWLHRNDKINEMAAHLRTEGWEYHADPTGLDAGLWVHMPTHMTVNQMGGFWRSYEEATVRTFESVTREKLLRRDQ